MISMTLEQAIDTYGEDLLIAGTGAIAKKGRTDEVRVIFDGSHGIDLNPGIKVPDQVKFPVAADGKAIMTEIADEGGPHFSLHIDFSKAHRRVAILLGERGVRRRDALAWTTPHSKKV